MLLVNFKYLFIQGNILCKILWSLGGKGVAAAWRKNEKWRSLGVEIAINNWLISVKI